MLRANAVTAYLCFQAADGFIRGLLYTVLAVYFVLRVGMDPFQLVLIGTILEASCFIFEIPTGILADVYSRRLSIVIGQTLFGLAYLVQGAVPLFLPIALAEVVRAIGETCVSGALQAWAAGEVPPERVARLFLRGVQARRIGRVLGIAASAALANIDLQVPLLTGGAMSLALAGALAAFMPESAFTPRTAKPARAMLETARTGIRAITGYRVLVLLLCLEVVLGAASEGVDRLWEAHLLTDFELPGLGALAPVTWFGVIEAGGLIVGILAAQVVTRLQIDEVPRIAQLTSAVIVARALAIALFALAPTWPMAIAARWLHVGLSGVAGPLLDAWLVRNTPPAIRATLFSTLGQGDAFGQAFGGPVLGAIGTWVSLRAAILSSAVLMLPGIALLRAAARADGDRSPRRFLSVQ